MASIKRNPKVEKLLVEWKRKRYSAEALNTLNFTEGDLEVMARYLADFYYNDDPLVDDSVFDVLFRTLKTINPKNAFIKHGIRAPVKAPTRKKVKLQSWMSSLDKLYPGDGIEAWAKKLGTSSLHISDKLDGFSIELSYDHKGAISLVSGGDGVYGQDLSHLIPHLDIPQKGVHSMVVRCEGVMVKAKHARFSNLFKTPRSALSNVFNNSKPNMEAVKATHIVALEIIKPAGLTISAQHKKLKSLGFKTPKSEIVPLRSFKEEKIREHYEQRRQVCPYPIDGIVVNANQTYTLPTRGNPKYAVAFKENAADSLVNAKVVAVEGNVSRTGRIIPLVVIEPTTVVDVTVTKLTGHNYGYIRDNKIAPGAIIKITRSGEVIPYIVEVVKPAKVGSMPNGVEGVDWQWDTDLDIKVVTKKGSEEHDSIQIKKLAYFASVMGITGLKEGVAAKLYYGGITSPYKLVKSYSAKKFAKIEGIGATQASNLNLAVDEVIGAGVELPLLATALAAFGSGVGYSKIKSVHEYLDLESLLGMTVKERIAAIAGVYGFTEKTASPIAKNIDKLFEWIERTGITILAPAEIAPVSSLMSGRAVMFTGFRSSELEDWILRHGGRIVTSMTQCNLLLVKDKSLKPSSKVLTAQAKGITIMSASEFIKTHVTDGATDFGKLS